MSKYMIQKKAGIKEIANKKQGTRECQQFPVYSAMPISIYQICDLEVVFYKESKEICSSKPISSKFTRVEQYNSISNMEAAVMEVTYPAVNTRS